MNICGGSAYDDLIDNAPTIEERKQGEWIEVIDSDCIEWGSFLIPKIKCSCCDYVPWDSKDCKYCPHCCAKMKGRKAQMNVRIK